MNDSEIIALIGLARFKAIGHTRLNLLRKLGSREYVVEALTNGIGLEIGVDPKPAESISVGKLEHFIVRFREAVYGNEDPHWFASPDPHGFVAAYNEVMADVDENWRLSIDGAFFRARCRAMWVLSEASIHEKIREFSKLRIQNYSTDQQQAIQDALDYAELTRTGLPPPPQIEIQRDK